MKKKEIIGYLIAIQGAAIIGPFALLSGLTQFDSINSYFIWIMVLGLLISLFGLYIVARSDEG